MLNLRANQLSEMVNPGRIYSEVGRCARAGATEFFLVNVSDIRPVPLSTDCAMRLAWDAKPFLQRGDAENMDAFYTDWCRRQYGPAVAARAAGIYGQYFNIPYHRPSTRNGDNMPHTLMKSLHPKVMPRVTAGQSLDKQSLKTLEDLLKYAANNLPYVADLNARAEALLPEIPRVRRPFYTGHLLTQTRIHLHSLQMLEAYGRALKAYAGGDKARALAQSDKALGAADRLFGALHAAEYGKWLGWYRGEGFVGLEASRDRLRALAAALRAQVPPPSRVQPSYEIFYQYQEPFTKNFPLLYPAGTANGKTGPIKAKGLN